MKLPSVFLTECKIGGLLKRRKNDLLKDYQDSKPLFWMALLFGPMAKTFVSPHIAPSSFGRGLRNSINYIKSAASGS